MKCIGIFQLLAFADNVYLLGENMNTIKCTAEALLFASKQVGPIPNAVKTKYVFMPHLWNEEQNHNIINPLKMWQHPRIWEQC